ncbi:hypothetical protein TNCV_4581591 [Trichonephila clavipes]|nr:hypothetical protein TNCV_4581591 [Trichonephila clavipes]
MQLPQRLHLRINDAQHYTICIALAIPNSVALQCTRVIPYQTDKLTVCVGGTTMTLNHIGMHGRKCRSYELLCKETEKKNRKSDTLIRQKTFYRKVAQQMFEIFTRSRLAGLTAVLHRIPDVLEDISRQSCGGCR